VGKWLGLRAFMDLAAKRKFPVCRKQSPSFQTINSNLSSNNNVIIVDAGVAAITVVPIIIIIIIIIIIELY
jgi:hypothetical protein